MSELTPTLVVSVALGCIAALYIGKRGLGALGGKSSSPLPPGPPGLPWVGTVFGIDQHAPWKTYAKWAKQYGDIMHVKLLGEDIVIINSEKIAKELLEQRSRNYSDRPFLLVNDWSGMGWNTVSVGYGDRWRQHRQFFHQTFRSESASRFVPFQNRKSSQLLRKVFDAPTDLENHVFEYIASSILSCVYEYDPESRTDELVDMMEHLLNTFIPVARPDVAVTIGAFPFLLYLPSWFPGMSVKGDMARVRQFVTQYLDQPFEHALRVLRNGSTKPSMVYDALRDVEEKGISPSKEWMQALKEATGTAFGAASETSNAVVMTFFMTMMLNPKAQERAQAQIDEVVGTNRLPTLEDRPSLPFVDAVFRETLRHSPTSPVAFPHAAVDDDIYNGYHIPKGATIIANVWSMAHNESRFPKPFEYIPERFLNDDGSLKPYDTAHLSFGFGRRVCVGKHFADTSVWLVITKVLALFKILKPLDANGKEIEVVPTFSSGLAIHPLAFPYRLVPRNPRMTTEKLDEMIATSFA